MEKTVSAAVQWFDIRDPKDKQLDELATRYGLHPLHIEDCRHRNQSAKMEEMEQYLFLVLKPMELQGDDSLLITDLDVFVGRDWVITVQESPCASVSQILSKTKERVNGLRSDQLCHRLLDQVVDLYPAILDRINDRIDGLEDSVLDRPQPEMLQSIFSTKRCLIEIRRVLVNTREMTGHLMRAEGEIIRHDLAPFLRDVYDHVVRSMDTVESQRDLLTGSLDIYLSSVANRTNETMKVLTVLGTIALPALIVSGFYGMNVRHLPYAETPHAIWIVTAVMLATTAGLLIYLKRRDYF